MLANFIFEKFLFPTCQKYNFLFHSVNQEKKEYNFETIFNASLEKIINYALNYINEDNSIFNHEKINFKENEFNMKKSRTNYISLNENDLFDLEDDYNEYLKEKNQIFFIQKAKKIINSSINDIFNEEQNNNMYKPFQMDIDNESTNRNNNINQNENLNIETNTLENNNIENNNNIEVKINSENKILEENSSYNLMTADISTLSDNIHNNNNINNIKVNNNTPNFIHDSYSNFNKYSRDYLPKVVFKNERFKNTDPFLKNFNPKFLKKENIDKKIFRKFRNFIKEKYQKSPNNLIFSYGNEFWKHFCTSNLLPPMKYQEYEFKSFNTKYFLWLFSQYGSVDLFKQFIEEKGKYVIDNFINEYNLEQSTEVNIIEKLKEYLNKIPIIYSRNKKQNTFNQINCNFDNSNEPFNYENNFRNEHFHFDYNDFADTYFGVKELNDDPSKNVFNTNFNFEFRERNSNIFDDEKEKEYIQRLDLPAMNLGFDY